ncbi:hypothetical protein ACOSQ4_005391 [Xanthoceras sorbifolium]
MIDFKFVGPLLNSLVFVIAVIVVTFILVLLFYLICTKFLKLYTAFSSFVVLGFMVGEIVLFFIEKFSVPIDSITFFVVLCNFAVLGVLVVSKRLFGCDWNIGCLLVHSLA